MRKIKQKLQNIKNRSIKDKADNKENQTNTCIGSIHIFIHSLVKREKKSGILSIKLYILFERNELKHCDWESLNVKE